MTLTRDPFSQQTLSSQQGHSHQLGWMDAGARGLLMPREGLQTHWEPDTPPSGPRDGAERQASACQSCFRKISSGILIANRSLASTQVLPVFHMMTGVGRKEGGVSGTSSSVSSSPGTVRIRGEKGSPALGGQGRRPCVLTSHAKPGPAGSAREQLWLLATSSVPAAHEVLVLRDRQLLQLRLRNRSTNLHTPPRCFSS